MDIPNDLWYCVLLTKGVKRHVKIDCVISKGNVGFRFETIRDG